jgi:hypothetical protein
VDISIFSPHFAKKQGCKLGKKSAKRRFCTIALPFAKWRIDLSNLVQASAFFSNKPTEKLVDG